MDELRKVRVLQNDGRSQLIRVEDTRGEFWIRRNRVHLVGDDYIITSERQASIMRGSLARQKAREAKRLAQEKLALDNRERGYVGLVRRKEVAA